MNPQMLLHPPPVSEGQFDARSGSSQACPVSPSDPANERRVPMAMSLFLVLRPVPLYFTRELLKQIRIFLRSFLSIPKCIRHPLHWTDNGLKHSVNHTVRVHWVQALARECSSSGIQRLGNMDRYSLSLQPI